MQPVVHACMALLAHKRTDVNACNMGGQTVLHRPAAGG